MSRNDDGADWNQTGRLASVPSFSVVRAMLCLEGVFVKNVDSKTKCEVSDEARGGSSNE